MVGNPLVPHQRLELRRAPTQAPTVVAAARAARKPARAAGPADVSARDQAWDLLAIAQDMLYEARCDPIALRLVKIASARLWAPTTAR